MTSEEKRAEVVRYWLEKAEESMASAKREFEGGSLTFAMNRLYYAAFYAVSALFALQGKTFSKHSAIEAAVHRDLVRPGHWPKELGVNYSYLLGLRTKGDYGVLEHVLEEEAGEAIQAVQRILRAVHDAHPDIFSDPEGVL